MDTPDTQTPDGPNTPDIPTPALQRPLVLAAALSVLLAVAVVGVLTLTSQNRDVAGKKPPTTRPAEQNNTPNADGVRVAAGESFSDSAPATTVNTVSPDKLLQSGEAPAVGDGVPPGAKRNGEDFDVPLEKPDDAPEFPYTNREPVEYVVGDAALNAALLLAVTPLWDPNVTAAEKSATLGAPDTTSAWEALNARNLGIKGATKTISSMLPGPGTCDVFGLSAGCASSSYTVRIGDQDVSLSATFVNDGGVWKPSVRSTCESLAALGTPCAAS
jgi:hypothetical protein